MRTTQAKPHKLIIYLKASNHLNDQTFQHNKMCEEKKLKTATLSKLFEIKKK